MSRSHGERRRSRCRRLLAVLVLLGVSCSPPSDGPPSDSGAPLVVGFNVGGFDWARPELLGVSDPEERARRIEAAAHLDARLVHGLGGNAVRIFFAVTSIVDPSFGNVHPGGESFYALDPEGRLERLDRIEKILRAYDENLPRGLDHRGASLDWLAVDAYLAGLARFNRTLPAEERIRVLLAAVAPPPREIIECPPPSWLRHFGRAYDAEELWQAYVSSWTATVQVLLRRIAARFPDAPELTFAFETVNEPDYWWIPDEQKIEKALDSNASPLDKYVVELYPHQIPVNDRPNKAFESAALGYTAQAIDWAHRPGGGEDPGEAETPVLDFDWGRKFDRYVEHYVAFHRALVAAARDEAARLGRPLEVVSGAVTHSNVDYLVRMHRADPALYDGVDAIGLHPYHWHEHDIWNDAFVSDASMDGWRDASPRRFANHFLKRFDFLEVVADLTRGGGGYGLGGRSLWLTEFGIPTKKLGEANAGLEAFPIFIYERGEPVPDAVAEHRVWEDLWERFLDQVDRDYLVSNRVEGLFLYTLREGLQASTNDDDNSNLAIFENDGRPRLAPETLERLESFLRSLSGRAPAPPP